MRAEEKGSSRLSAGGGGHGAQALGSANKKPRALRNDTPLVIRRLVINLQERFLASQNNFPGCVIIDLQALRERNSEGYVRH